jgi:hypothetical protein
MKNRVDSLPVASVQLRWGGGRADPLHSSAGYHYQDWSVLQVGRHAGYGKVLAALGEASPHL